MAVAGDRPACPPGAGEPAQLVGWLDLQRAIVAWKCEGLSEADAHRSVLPTSPYMTMAGIVSHLRWAERATIDQWLRAYGADGSGRTGTLGAPGHQAAGVSIRRPTT